MEQSWYIIIVSMFLLHFTDSFPVPEAPVEGFVGGSVVLSCFIHDSELQDRIKEVTVHWRYNNSKIVIDIIEGKRTAEDQAPEYKNGVETFPEEYKKGNFSIKINNIKKTHIGKYTCTITGPFQKETHAELFVKDKPEEKVNHGKPLGIVLSIAFVLIIFIISIVYIYVYIFSITVLKNILKVFVI